MTQNSLLTINSLNLLKEQTKLLNDVYLHVNKGEIVGLVDLSGSGKSLLAKSILQLLPPALRITQGSIVFNGRELVGMQENQLTAIRGKCIGLIQQNPMTALNPTLSIGRQLTEGILHHEGIGYQEAKERAIGLLSAMDIMQPEQRMNDLPCQLSGGMRQRVLIAMTFSCRPQLIVADEPTTALDVTTQRQILQLLTMNCKQSLASLLLITHDLALVGKNCDRVYIIKEGEIVECGETEQVFREPRHSYTRELLQLRRVNR